MSQEIPTFDINNFTSISVEDTLYKFAIDNKYKSNLIRIIGNNTETTVRFRFSKKVLHIYFNTKP